MKSILMNSGGMRWDDVDHQVLTDPFMNFCRTLFADGRGTHPDGDMDVRFQVDCEAGWYEISAAGVVLLESIVVARGHLGQTAWNKFHHLFSQLVDAGEIQSDQAVLGHPGRGPWSAVLLHPAMIFLPEDEITRVAWFQSAIARAFAK